MGDSTPEKPEKRPRRKDGFPLWQHKPTGYWCKTIKGRRWYFGKIEGDEDGRQALKLWLEEKDHLLAGELPPSRVDYISVQDIVDEFLLSKRRFHETGELGKRMLDEYEATAAWFVKQLGERRKVDDLSPRDFADLRYKLAKKYGPTGLAKRIVSIRSILKFARSSGLIDEPTYGPEFSLPKAKRMRQHRQAKGRMDYSADDVRKLLSVARPNARAFILLGVSCGLGNTDCAELPRAALDLEAGWMDYPRAKTATPRRIPVWPETIEAIRLAMAAHPHDGPLVFCGPRRKAYTDPHRTGHRVGGAFRQAVKDAGMVGDIRGFYSLRRTFATIASGVRDIEATRAIMGHADSESDMTSRYRQAIADERLQNLVEHVRRWLLPIPPPV